MVSYSKVFLGAAIIMAATFVFQAQAQTQNQLEDELPQPVKFYKYAHNEAEYSIMLPEAPTVKTIWGNSEGKDIPYLDNPPKEGFIGEHGILRWVDQKTEDVFDVKITFLKASYVFLKKLTPEKMEEAIRKDFKGIKLDGEKFEANIDDKGMKKASLTGFSIDPNNRPLFNAEHYLTGQQSILVVKVQYSIENKTFEDYYNKLAQNITYYAP